jgi:hypothetical protein
MGEIGGRCQVAEVIVVANAVGEDGMQRFHVMSNEEISLVLPPNAKWTMNLEGGVYHLRGEWPYFGMLDIQAAGWPRMRRILVWSLREGERVSEAIGAAAEMWMNAVGWEPKFAWVRALPQGAEWCQNVYGCILLAAEWMPRNCVAVGGRR